MIRKWILMGLTVGLLAAAISSGALLASGGGPVEGGEGNTKESGCQRRRCLGPEHRRTRRWNRGSRMS